MVRESATDTIADHLEDQKGREHTAGRLGDDEKPIRLGPAIKAPEQIRNPDRQNKSIVNPFAILRVPVVLDYLCRKTQHDNRQRRDHRQNSDSSHAEFPPWIV